MKKENDLGKDSVIKLVLRLAIPAMLAQFINVLYGIVDRIYIGNLPEIGDYALSGTGVCAPIATLITSFAFLIGTGGAPYFSMSLGEKKSDDAKKILSNSFLMLFILSTIITIIVLIFKKPLLMTFGASEISYIYAKEYLTYYALGSIFAIMSLGLNQFIVAQGFSKVGMKTIVIGAILNIILDPIFIFGFNLGVKGAAIATVFSQSASFFYVILFLFSKKPEIKISFGNYDFSVIKKIIKLGLSPFIIIATDSLIIIALNSILQYHGGDEGDYWITIATIVQSFMQLITMPLLGITGGTQPILSYNYGSKDFDRVKKAQKVILTLCLIFTSIMFVLSFLISPIFVQIFTNNAEIIKLSRWGIGVYMIGVIPLSFQYSFVDSLTALGQPKFAIFLSLFRKIGLIFTFTLILPYLFDVSTSFYAEPISDILSAITSTAVFLIVFPKILEKRRRQKNLDLLEEKN